MKEDEVYILTDGCMYEKNKQEGTYHPHASEVVNYKTGQVRYLKSGAKITIVEGLLSEGRSQEIYNKEVAKVSNGRKDKFQRGSSKKGGGKVLKKEPRKNESV